MVSDAVFLRYVVLSGSMEPEIPTGSVVVVDGRKKEWNPGDGDYLPERKYGGDTPDRGKERGRILY